MKFGSLTTSYKIVIGFETSPVLENTIIPQTKIDGSKEYLNFGALEEQTASFTVAKMTQAEYTALADLLIENTGKAVKITQENTSEVLFTEEFVPVDNDYYVKILKTSNFQEPDFSTNKDIFEFKVEVQLLGETATSTLNTADSANYDILIDIDTTQGATIGGTEPADPNELDRWLDTAGNEGTPNYLYECVDPDGSTFAERWEYFRQVASNDSSIGWEDGQFHLSSFADVSQDVGNDVLYDYVSNLITFQSVNVSGKSIDLRKGPAIAHKTGFSFSLDNTMDEPDASSMFWKFIIDEGITLYNAVCSLSFYRKSPKAVEKHATGINITNTFSYTDYIFQIEPVGLDYKQVFPLGEISEDDERGIYDNIDSDYTGKAPYATFGQWKYAALQNVSIEDETVEFYDNDKNQDTNNIEAAIDYTVATNTRVLVAKDTSTGYTISDELLSVLDDGEHALIVRSDNASDNEGESRKITAIDDSEPSGYTGWYIIDLKDSLPVRPTQTSGDPPQTDDRINIEILHSSLRYQIDENESLGFGSLEEDEFVDSIDVYKISDNGLDMVQIPKTGFIENDDKNRLILLPQARGTASTIYTYEEALRDSNNPKGPIDKSFLKPDKPEFTLGQYGLELELPSWPPTGFRDAHYEVKSPSAGTDTKYNCIFCAKEDSGNFAGILNEYKAYPFYSLGGTPSNIIQQGVSSNVSIGFHNEDNEGYIAHVHNFPVNHTDIREEELLDAESVLMAIDMHVTSVFQIISYIADGLSFNPHDRFQGMGFKVRFRFKKTNGTYITDDDWTFEVTDKQLKLTLEDLADPPSLLDQNSIEINNYPDGDEDGGFSVDNTSLVDNYEYLINYIVADTTERDALTDVIYGDRAYVTGTQSIHYYDATGWHYDAAVVDGTVMAESAYPVQVVIVADSSEANNYRDAVDGVDFNLTPALQGRGLIDITKMFPTDWPFVEHMEMVIYNNDYSDYQYNEQAASVNAQRRRWHLDWWLNKPFRIYTSKSFDVADGQLFATVRGRDLSGITNYYKPYYITKSIMDSTFPGLYDEDSLENVILSTALRWDWVLHKQFIRADSDNTVLSDLLWNLWAAAYYDENDKIVFASLSSKDNNYDNPSRVFTDSDIIMDSFSRPRMRKAGEIYQDFKLNFDQQIQSSFSSKINEYRTQIINRNNANTEELSYITSSRRLYNNEKVFSKNFDYHFQGNDLPFATDLVRFFSHNTWELSFSIPIQDTFGSESLSLIQTIGLNSFFHTDSVQLNGYVVGLKPDYYKGNMKVTMFIPDPPDRNFCDFFKDALLIPDRGDVSTWTEANDLVNDAGSFPRSSTDLEDNAGTIGSRNLTTC